MPLDNKNLTPEMQELLIGLPLDEECWRKSYELPHQTKVMIYDTHCINCGFKRLTVGDFKINSLDKAISVAQALGAKLNRSCEYPGDIQIVNGKEVYPTLTEIVINGCRFWRKENIEGEDDEYNMETPINGEGISE